MMSAVGEACMEVDLDRFDSRRSNVLAQRGVVATSQPLAAQAGVSILQAGGNAFDAAVATAAALNVVEPTSTGLGGDVFALYRTADGEVGAMRACGSAPQAATIENVRDALADAEDLEWQYRGDEVPDLDRSREHIPMPTYGPHAVTVPGTARGWEFTVDRFGELELADVLEPAIHYATEGYPVSEVIAGHWGGAESLFRDDYARQAYLFDDEAPAVGQHVTLPDLGESMRAIAKDGADVVYEGYIADAIVETVREAGGFMAHEDLSSFEPEEPTPISTTYNGAEVYELPPNNQGLIALEALNIAEEIGAGEHRYDSPDRVHAFVEALKLAFADGHHYITDPEYEEIPPLASKAYAAERAKAISEQANTTPSIGDPWAVAEDADTVLLTVGDEEGNLVSYINSRFAGFGSGLVAEGTGIALQNRGSSFSLDPTHPNRLEPGKRPFHTLVPAIARFGPDDWAAFGVMGGFMQPQGHLQVISNIVDHGMAPQAALDAPRWRHRDDGTLAVEERLPTAGKLVRRGHDVRIQSPSGFGGAQLVRRTNETLIGATEPRKDGAAIGY